MVKIANLIIVLKTLLVECKPQSVIAEKPGCLQNIVSKHIHRRESVVGKGAQAVLKGLSIKTNSRTWNFDRA